jgi:hypothetical protein
MTEDWSCPFCEQTDWKNEINLARHIEKEHYYKSITSYIRLRVKIDTFITYRKDLLKKMESNTTPEYSKSTTTYYVIQEEIKLLEDLKK